MLKLFRLIRVWIVWIAVAALRALMFLVEFAMVRVESIGGGSVDGVHDGRQHDDDDWDVSRASAFCVCVCLRDDSLRFTRVNIRCVRKRWQERGGLKLNHDQHGMCPFIALVVVAPKLPACIPSQHTRVRSRAPAHFINTRHTHVTSADADVMNELPKWSEVRRPNTFGVLKMNFVELLLTLLLVSLL